MNYKEAMDLAHKMNSKMTIYDFHPNRYVHVQTDEGMIYSAPSAFVLETDPYYLVFAEHHEPKVFAINDVMLIYQAKKNLDIKKVKQFKYDKRGNKWRKKNGV